MNCRPVLSGHFAERYAAGPRGKGPPNHKACAPALALLDFLSSRGVLEAPPQRPLRRTCATNKCAESGEKVFRALDPSAPELRVALRLLQLEETTSASYLPVASYMSLL